MQHLEFFELTLFMGFSFALVIIVYLLSFLLSFSKVYNSSAVFEKISPYECGFNPFEDSRNQFDISFYLIGILFIIFDLEVSFLFPWVLALNHINIFGFLSMLVFLVVLTIGFIYEWFSGALDFA
jgi:NADH:ubiquinone oxidoreductase subunit 3 (subunit A)